MYLITIPKDLFDDIYTSKTMALQVLNWMWKNADNNGVVSVSSRNLCTYLNIGRQQARTAIEKLVSVGVIIKLSDNPQVTQYAICKSDSYTHSQPTDNPCVTHKQPTNQPTCNPHTRCVSGTYGDKQPTCNPPDNPPITNVGDIKHGDKCKQPTCNPQESSFSGSYRDSQPTCNPSQDNDTIYNIYNNIDNNNIIVDNIDNIDNKIESAERKREKRFVKPSVSEIEEYIKEKGFSIDAQYFYDYYESVSWFRGKTKIKNWKLVINTWNKNNSQRENHGTNSINIDREKEKRMQGYANVMQEFVSQCD